MRVDGYIDIKEGQIFEVKGILERTDLFERIGVDVTNNRVIIAKTSLTKKYLTDENTPDEQKIFSIYKELSPYIESLYIYYVADDMQTRYSHEFIKEINEILKVTWRWNIEDKKYIQLILI